MIELQYIVIKTFQSIEGVKIPGETIELDDARAAKLRSRGLIGGAFKEPEIKQTEDKEVKPVKEKAVKKVK